MGRSNCMVVEVAESSSILFGSEVAIFRVLRIGGIRILKTPDIY